MPKFKDRRVWQRFDVEETDIEEIIGFIKLGSKDLISQKENNILKKTLNNAMKKKLMAMNFLTNKAVIVP